MYIYVCIRLGTGVSENRRAVCQGEEKREWFAVKSFYLAFMEDRGRERKRGREREGERRGRERERERGRQRREGESRMERKEKREEKGGRGREGKEGRRQRVRQRVREREKGKERKNKRDSVSHCWAVSTVRCPHPTHCPLQPWRWVEGRRSSGVRRTWTEWQPGTAHTCRLSCTRHSVLTLRSPYHCLPCVACA